MRFGPPARIVAASLVLALALGGVVAREGLALAHGQEVSLAINMYDPRSLLSGHYLQFQLRDFPPAGSGCPPGTMSSDGPPPDWVALSPAGARHRVTGAAHTRAQAANLGEIVVRGQAFCSAPRDDRRPAVTLEIGVDRIHASQAEAEAIAERMGDDDPDHPSAVAVVSVGRDGKARLKGLIAGDRRIDLNWF